MNQIILKHIYIKLLIYKINMYILYVRTIRMSNIILHIIARKFCLSINCINKRKKKFSMKKRIPIKSFNL